MAKLIVNTNPNLNNNNALLLSIAQSVVSSSMLEGINISIEEVLKMVNSEYANLQKSKK